LSNAALHDVATMLCDLKGIVIDKLNHDLKFVAKNNIDEAIASVTPYLIRISKQKTANWFRVNSLFNIKARIKAKNHSGFLNALKLQVHNRL
jgi:hypothetical protein